MNHTVAYADKLHSNWIEAEGVSQEVSVAMLDQLAVRSEHDFISHVAGYLGNPSAGQLSIRGLNNDNILGYVGTRSNSLISTLANGVPLSASTTRYFPQTLWGIETASVLKGGQSTTYGPNAMGGIVAYQYAKPEFNNSGELKTEFGTANTFRGYLSQNLKLNAQSALKLSYQRLASDGFVENTTTGQDDWEKTDRDSFTLQYLWLSEDQQSELHALLKYDDSQSNPFGAVRSFGNYTAEDRKTDENTRTLYPADHWLGSVNYSRNSANGLQVHNTLGASTLNVNSLIDLDGSAFLPWTLRHSIDEHHFSNDFNLRGELGEHLWTLGAFAQKSEYNVAFRGLGLVGNGIPFNSRISEDVETLSLYGKFNYQINNQWSATAGLRLNHEDRKLSTHAATALSLPQNQRSSSADTELLPSLSLTYAPSERYSYGLKLSHNYRSGGVSFAPTLGLHQSYAPEYSNDIELYLKARPSDDLQFSAALFYNELTDAQVPVNVAGGIPNIDRLVVNSAEGYRWGAEAQATWQLHPSTTIDCSLAYVDTEFTTLSLNNRDLSGSAFPNAPEFTGSLGILYSHDSGLYASTRLAWASSSFTEVTSQSATALEDRTDLSAKVGFRHNHWNLYVFAHNLLDKDYAVGRIDATAVGIGVLNKMNSPRSIGVGCSLSW